MATGVRGRNFEAISEGKTPEAALQSSLFRISQKHVTIAGRRVRRFEERQHLAGQRLDGQAGGCGSLQDLEE